MGFTVEDAKATITTYIGNDHYTITTLKYIVWMQESIDIYAVNKLGSYSLCYSSPSRYDLSFFSDGVRKPSEEFVDRQVERLLGMMAFS